jgi:hypothetical protein
MIECLSQSPACWQSSLFDLIGDVQVVQINNLVGLQYVCAIHSTQRISYTPLQIVKQPAPATCGAPLQ